MIRKKQSDISGDNKNDKNANDVNYYYYDDVDENLYEDQDNSSNNINDKNNG